MRWPKRKCSVALANTDRKERPMEPLTEDEIDSAFDFALDSGDPDERRLYLGTLLGYLLSDDVDRPLVRRCAVDAGVPM